MTHPIHRSALAAILLCLVALSAVLTTAPASAAAPALKSRTFCIYDPTGSGGFIYDAFQSYIKQARAWGYDLKPHAYIDEAVAADDFKAGRCDMVALSGFRTLQFVKFAGSLDMAGGVQTYAEEHKAIDAMAGQRAAPYMQSNGMAVVGVVPLGKLHMFSRQKSYLIKPNGLAGKKMAVLSYDRQASTLAKRVGASPVPTSIASFGTLFANGAVDLAYAPASAYKPLELDKGMGRDGGVSDFVLGMVSDQLTVHSARFDDSFAAQSRQWVSRNLFDPMVVRIKAAEQHIPAHYWVHVPPRRQHGYEEMFRSVREQLWKSGWYSHRMQRLLKQIRCDHDAGASECSTQSEGGLAG